MQNVSDKLPGGRHGFLPDFCRIRLTLAVVIAAELLTIVLCIARFTTLENFWSELSMLSLFIQWIALPVSAGLCLLKKRLMHRSVLFSSLVALLLLLCVTALVSWLAYTRVLSHQSAQDQLSFMAQSLAVSFLVGLMVLHYFYLQYLLTRQQQAEADARYEALQARIRPHFLFNSMNTIASLTRSDPEMAENVVVDLAELFRAAMSAGGRPSTLQDELLLVRGYLNIEQMRLAERLQVDWRIDEALPALSMPSMLLQPLVENAVYHGIEPAGDGGDVRIQVQAANGLVRILISNSLPVNELPAEQLSRQGNNQAQDNIRQRMESFYGEAGEFATWLDAGRYHVQLTIDTRVPA